MRRDVTGRGGAEHGHLGGYGVGDGGGGGDYRWTRAMGTAGEGCPPLVSRHGGTRPRRACSGGGGGGGGVAESPSGGEPGCATAGCAGCAAAGCAGSSPIRRAVNRRGDRGRAAARCRHCPRPLLGTPQRAWSARVRRRHSRRVWWPRARCPSWCRPPRFFHTPVWPLDAREVFRHGFPSIAAQTAKSVPRSEGQRLEQGGRWASPRSVPLQLRLAAQGAMHTCPLTPPPAPLQPMAATRAPIPSPPSRLSSSPKYKELLAPTLPQPTAWQVSTMRRRLCVGVRGRRRSTARTTFHTRTSSVTQI